ncbi:MAG: hypothetical protein PSV40_04460 [Polaromonas sp.]|jgi:hypothetical protein|uniref:hypothetical protein n=1 Tax=Polaromonas sp. TaxID=1869339 RepID=UPI002489A74B|nr:hypothetical protein [Polaromonas sp.]MDI1268339.1 hypothetical protein [Polaromonas sp.]
MRPDPIPTLTQRALELQSLGLPESRFERRGGKELWFYFHVAPGRFGRLYSCLLKLSPDSRKPELFVVKPDLHELAVGATIPHIYPHKGRGTKLCLWWPRGREWVPQMSLRDTYVPWAAEWLFFFEDWLLSGEWAGGGQHPKPKRWSRLHAAEALV